MPFGIEFPPLTLGVLATGTGVIAETAFKHLLSRVGLVGSKDEVEARRKQFAFDEGFSVAKKILEKSGSYTVEEVQKFGNSHVPSPWWVRVVHVSIPVSTLGAADDLLVKAFGGEEECRKLCGGTHWWRGRFGDGQIPGEWIAMKKDWKDHPFNEDEDEPVKASKHSNRKPHNSDELDRNDPSFLPQESSAKDGKRESDQESHEYENDLDELPCMLYVHGGAYYFGSINTHRYSLWRYARKMSGRVFAVVYRLAPQFPFPCALTDALASYLYLIRPPSEAKHRAIDPKKIVIAGDSAGGGLALALICAIRDLDLPLPAGVVLISPWVDLTHSFPSILQNTETDIIPKYGFLHKPSVLWPPPPVDYIETQRSSMLHSSLKYKTKYKEFLEETSLLSSSKHSTHTSNQESQPTGASEMSKDGMTEEVKERPQEQAEPHGSIKIQVDGKDVVLNEQIQLYATNEQLTNRFVSPILQPTLAGLPPMFIMCGDKEVLRDEIIYMAHRCAHPDLYPVREGLKETRPEMIEKAEGYAPTKVHLQVYDDAPHVLPLFSFTTPAKYSYRAISSFCVWVTQLHENSRPSPRFFLDKPITQTPESSLLPSSSGENLSDNSTRQSNSMRRGHKPSRRHSGPLVRLLSVGNQAHRQSSFPKREITTDYQLSEGSGSRGKIPRRLSKTIYYPTVPSNRPDFEDGMIRERIAINGVVRPLEPTTKIPLFSIKPEEIGYIKESAVKRYINGKAIWDRKYKKLYVKIQHKREETVRNVIQKDLERLGKKVKDKVSQKMGGKEEKETENGRLDFGLSNYNISKEVPPPSSIAARKDTREAVELAKVLREQNAQGINNLAIWADVNELGAMGLSFNIFDAKDHLLNPLTKMLTRNSAQHDGDAPRSSKEGRPGPNPDDDSMDDIRESTPIESSTPSSN